ncbi:MAG: hypothetical protein CO042_04085 [Parcubacteria group bacterium CG_4_9_14_0_2_um_filter_41_8]|nr:MAG: hypothetical protein COW93_01145 [Parcubacteria group bacterium CG22_combo_CG10-13_8_21_14_all_41_9]PIQ80295.1 MAG: hypothetical protein COV79_01255 [Parcubacteria group bacterium CG11_big_fil_rev_8_21_14_0_20_41_14]PIR57235.1 MAG: hypothetical protein COU72_02020 [Parcubacteria group bacterium CG10_big_fil_rev_8_21_14_0_10_41_35]PIZ80273.1 MAG: hypothetical protein COY02_03635 [Parcubacteria group bacterium CG_4_10_14_0_2_um_filter_41_6]PJC40376.1 MAG: hypothetical protein CO042_04085 
MSNEQNQKIKDLYETSIKDKYKNDYEFRRWFLSERLRLDYFMTRTAIMYHMRDDSFVSCLEFGPGSGIFTPIAYRRNPNAKFDLIDISEEMKNQFALEVRGRDNVNYIVGDILEHEFNQKYDFFYSVRAIEYVEDKEVLFKNIYSLMNEGGKGVIVTKNPFYGSAEHGDGTRWQHTGKLGIKDMRNILNASGFKSVAIYPVIVRFPVIERFTLKFTEKYFNKIYRNPISEQMSRFIESYIVMFEK